MPCLSCCPYQKSGNGTARRMLKRFKTKAKAETKDQEKTETNILSGSHCVEQFPRCSEEVHRFMAALLEAPKGDELARCAESFFDDFAARGWKDSRGIPLADWKPAARKYARSWAVNNIQKGRQGNVPRKDANEGRSYRR